MASAFQRLVATLRRAHKTCVTVEQCCGGTISSNILAQPGASAVYWGGSTAYNTRHAKALLLNSDVLHQQLLNPLPKDESLTSEAEQYIQSKVEWTAKTSVAFCEELQSDFAIAEGLYCDGRLYATIFVLVSCASIYCAVYAETTAGRAILDASSRIL